MPDSYPGWAQWLAPGGAAAVIGGGLWKALTLLSSKKKDDFEVLRGTVDALGDQVKAALDGLKDCHEHHEECEKGRREDREAHRKELLAVEKRFSDQIARLMAGEPANYQPSDLKRVGKRRA